jgi:hypothetical protein
LKLAAMEKPSKASGMAGELEVVKLNYNLSEI